MLLDLWPLLEEVRSSATSGRRARLPKVAPLPPLVRRVQVSYGPATITGKAAAAVPVAARTTPGRVTARAVISPQFEVVTRPVISAEHRGRIVVRASLPDDLELLLLAAAVWE